MTFNDEINIPPALLPKAQAWYTRQLAKLEQAHGSNWPDHREFLEAYLNEELLESLDKWCAS